MENNVGIEQRLNDSDTSSQLPDVSDTTDSGGLGVEDIIVLDGLEQNSENIENSSLDSMAQQEIIIQKLDDILTVIHEQNYLMNSNFSYGFSIVGVLLLYFVGRLLYKFINNILLGGI